MSRSLFMLLCVILSVSMARGEDAGGEKPQDTNLPRIKQKQEKKWFREVSEKELAELVNIPSRPVACPICGTKVEIPLREPGSRDVDADLCPHYSGKVMFYSGIALCPDCGFAAYQSDFIQPQSEETKNWVLSQLQPNMRDVETHLFGIDLEKAKIKKSDLPSFFSQETLPDIVRCEHAFAYYSRRNAPLSLQAKLAWLCAWSYRRAACEPVAGSYLMESIQRITQALDRDNLVDPDVEKKINILASYYDQKTRFDYQARQLIRIILSGNYNRMGYTSWATVCLEQVYKSTTREWAGEADPWLECTDPKSQNRQEEADRRKCSVRLSASTRLEQIKREQAYLKLSGGLMRSVLQSPDCPSDKAVTYLYLIGEFARRQESFVEARLWLEAADKTVPLGYGGIEQCAAGQLEAMNDYIARQGKTQMVGYEQQPEDAKLLDEVFQRLKPAPKTNE